MLHILGYFYTVNEFWVVELILANVAYEITWVFLGNFVNIFVRDSNTKF